MKKLALVMALCLMSSIVYAETIVTDVTQDTSRKRFVTYEKKLIGEIEISNITRDETFSKQDLDNRIVNLNNQIQDLQNEIIRLQTLEVNFK